MLETHFAQMGLLLEIALLGIPLHPPVSSLFPSSPQEECSRLEIAPPSPGPNFPWCRISLLRAVANPVGFVRLFHSSPPPVFLRGLVCPRRLSLFLSSSLACCCCSSSSSRPTDPYSPSLPCVCYPLIESIVGLFFSSSWVGG